MYAFADAFLISSRRQLNYLRSQPVSPSLIPHINVAYLNAGLAVETALKALIAHDSDCRQYPAVHPSARLITYLTDARRGALEAFYEERQVDGGLESLCGLLDYALLDPRKRYAEVLSGPADAHGNPSPKTGLFFIDRCVSPLVDYLGTVLRP